jgi:hypothetical protein
MYKLPYWWWVLSQACILLEILNLGCVIWCRFWIRGHNPLVPGVFVWHYCLTCNIAKFIVSLMTYQLMLHSWLALLVFAPVITHWQLTQQACEWQLHRTLWGPVTLQVFHCKYRLLCKGPSYSSLFIRCTVYKWVSSRMILKISSSKRILKIYIGELSSLMEEIHLSLAGQKMKVSILYQFCHFILIQNQSLVV